MLINYNPACTLNLLSVTEEYTSDILMLPMYDSTNSLYLPLFWDGEDRKPQDFIPATINCDCCGVGHNTSLSLSLSAAASRLACPTAAQWEGRPRPTCLRYSCRRRYVCLRRGETRLIYLLHFTARVPRRSHKQRSLRGKTSYSLECSGGYREVGKGQF